MRIFLIILSLIFVGRVQAQKLDSIYFNLYTDSLKKGTFNYINVDGKYSNGNYLPLTAKELEFSASSGKFDGNSLFLDSTCKEPKITVRVALKSNPAIFRERTIYIKTMPDNEPLKTMDEVMKPKRKTRNM